MMLTFVNVIWGARCGKTARRVLLGETRTRGHAYSVRRRRESACDRKAPHRLKSSRLVSTNLLDLWFEKKIKPKCRGEAYLVRFADDFVVSFQYRQDVDHFQQKVRKRFAEFGLELAEEKTRRILFGRFAGVTCLRHGLGRPETFEFLGFKHVGGVDRKGRFALIRIPSAKSCRKFLARTREWILHNRHWRRWEQQERLTKMLRGFYQYFGLHHCERKLNWVRQQVQRQWISALNRPGQRRRRNGPAL